MGIFIILLVCNLIIPLLMLAIGLSWEKHAPKEPNWAVGYRTTRAMKSQESWDFAQKYMARLWKRIGFGLLIPSVALSVVGYLLGEAGISILTVILETVQVAVLIGSIFPVEHALKKNFDGNGKPIGTQGADTSAGNTVCREDRMVREKKPMGKAEWAAVIFTVCVTAVILAVLSTGNVEAKLEEDHMDIICSYWKDRQLTYDDIERVEYAQDWETGSRVGGFGSFRLNMGRFENKETGRYDLYAYVDSESYVLLYTREGVVAVGGRDEAATKELYEALKERLP